MLKNNPILFLVLFSATCLCIFYISWKEPTYPDDLSLIPIRMILRAQNTTDKEKQAALYDSIKTQINYLMQEKDADTTLKFYLAYTYTQTNNLDSALSIHLENLKHIDSVRCKDIYSKTKSELARNYFLEGLKFMNAKEADKGLQAFNQSFIYVPYFAASVANIAQHQIDNGAIDSAKVMINESIKLFPDKAFLYNVLGYAYYKENNFPESKNCFQRSLELSPNDEYATTMLNILNTPINK
jgi:tetratricopeptide (TPR) repeat protein